MTALETVDCLEVLTETVLAKGIRVNQLAKEIGVPSKVILEKCKVEGLAEKVPNHMTVLSLGLAETVREWFSGHEGGGTAVETAPAMEVAAKPKACTSSGPRCPIQGAPSAPKST